MGTIQFQFDRIAKILAVSLAFCIPISTTITQVLLLCIVICIFVSGQWKTGAALLVSHPAVRMGICLWLIFCLGILYSVAPLSDSFHMLAKMSKVLYLAVLIPLFVEEKWRRKAIIAFILAMILTLILGSLKTYHLLPAFSEVRYHNCAFKNHIDTNLLMSMTVFFLGHYLFLQTNRYLKIAIMTLLMLMTVYVLGISEGRTGYVIFSTLWLLFLWQRMTLKQCLLGLSFLILVLSAAYLLPSQLQQRLSHVVAEVDHYRKGNAIGSVGQRLEFLQSSFALVKQKPWLGFGTGGFKTAYTAYAKEHNQDTTSNPHSEFFNILVQWGLLGFMVFLIFMWTLFKSSLLLPVKEKFIAQGILFGILVGCTANSLIMDFTSGYFFVTFIAILLAALPSPLLQKQPAVSRTTLLETASLEERLRPAEVNHLRDGVVL
jgi:O-antigen ligase